MALYLRGLIWPIYLVLLWWSNWLQQLTSTLSLCCLTCIVPDSMVYIWHSLWYGSAYKVCHRMKQSDLEPHVFPPFIRCSYFPPSQILLPSTQLSNLLLIYTAPPTHLCSWTHLNLFFLLFCVVAESLQWEVGALLPLLELRTILNC